MKGRLALGLCAGISAVLVACGTGGWPATGDGGAEPTSCDTDFTRLAGADPVSLHDDVMPIFGLGCAHDSCHGGDAPVAGLYLGVRCVFDPSTRGCIFPDAPDAAAYPMGVMPLTPDIVARVRENLLVPSRTAPAVQRVAPGKPGASFLIDKISGTHDTRGYDCVSLGPEGPGGPCGAEMPFGGSALCGTSSGGQSRFDTIATWVLQGARDD